MFHSILWRIYCWRWMVFPDKVCRIRSVAGKQLSTRWAGLCEHSPQMSTEPQLAAKFTHWWYVDLFPAYANFESQSVQWAVGHCQSQSLVSGYHNSGHSTKDVTHCFWANVVCHGLSTLLPDSALWFLFVVWGEGDTSHRVHSNNPQFSVTVLDFGSQ